MYTHHVGGNTTVKGTVHPKIIPNQLFCPYKWKPIGCKSLDQNTAICTSTLHFKVEVIKHTTAVSTGKQQDYMGKSREILMTNILSSSDSEKHCLNF